MAKKCTHCNINPKADENLNKIPLIAAECEATRQYETIKGLIYAIMLLTVLLFGSNLAWLFFGGVV